MITRKILFVLLLPLSISTMAAEDNQVTISTPMSSQSYYQLGNTICQLLNEQTANHGIVCKTSATEGSVDSIKSLRSGESELALVQSNLQSYAYEASHSFMDMKPFTNLRTLASFHPHALTILARADSDVDTFYNLRAKRISVGNPDSERETVFKHLMEIYRWSPDTFSSMESLAEDKQAQALCSDMLDAAIYMASHPASIIKEATNLCDLRLVRVNGKPVQRTIRKNDNYKWYTIPRDIYPGNEQAVRTFGVGVNLVASSELDDDIVYRIVNAISSNGETLEQFTPITLEYKTDNMEGDTMIVPLHAGAIRYIDNMEMKSN